MTPHKKGNTILFSKGEAGIWEIKECKRAKLRVEWDGRSYNKICRNETITVEKVLCAEEAIMLKEKVSPPARLQVNLETGK